MTTVTRSDYHDKLLYYIRKSVYANFADASIETEADKSMRLNDATPENWDEVKRSKYGNGTTAHMQQVELPLKSADVVNSPPHYTNGKIECIEGIKAMLTSEEFIGYLRGNSLKYRWRYPYKNGIEDLNKAAWYENRLLEVLEDDRKKLS